MSLALLSTKLYIPPARADRISRPRLVERLRAGLDLPGCFTLLSGPAGSGKTTLLSDLAARLRAEREWAVAWLSLDEADNDPARFWSYLVAACRQALPGAGESVREMLARMPQPLADDAIPTLLINDLAAQPARLALVLDDFHLINHPAVLAGCAFLLQHLPANLHVILATRTDPPWPLARFRARGCLVEIRAQDLRFTQVETTEFLNRSMGLELSAEDIAALEERTEGWAAGLQLAALSMQGILSERGDVEAFVRAFTGSHVYVAEYLLEEVLQRQSEETQDFLLRTAILDRFEAGLCEAVTGRGGGQTCLAALHKANIFLIPLDDAAAGKTGAGWFRYHHLFADLLRAYLLRTLSAGEIAALHARASAWYEQAGSSAEAVDHALAAKDFERAAALVEEAARTLIFSSQLSLLRRWLDAIPETIFSARSHLVIFRLYLDMIQGRLDVNPQALLEKEQLIRAIPPSPENDALRVELMAFLCRFVAFVDPPRALQMAGETLAGLPEENTRLRSHLYSALCIAHGMEGDAARAEATYLECRRLALAAGHYALLSHTTMIVAQGLPYFSRMREAAVYCRAVIALGDQLGQNVFYPAGHGCLGLGGLLLEWNQLEEAEETIRRGIELCRQGGLDGPFTGHALLARLHQARGDFAAALAELDYLDREFQRRDFSVLSRRILILLAQGDTPAVARWEVPLAALLAGPRLPVMVTEAILAILARIRIALGGLKPAAPLLDELEASAAAGGRSGRLLEASLLRARIALAQGQQEQAAAYLKRALALAEPDGFVLTFLEEGPTLLPLLRALESHPYARRLVAAQPQPAPAAPPAGLVEPLTARELEVLRCIAAGDSNQAIAGRLVISVRTVKKHTSNIFGKLGVASRTQAGARARELGVLDD